MSDKTRAALAVDLGGSKFIVGFVDNSGRVLHSHREEWLDRSDAASVRKQFMSAIEKELSTGTKYDIVAAGMVVPGFADTERGVIVSMSLGGMREWPAAEIFKKEFGLNAYLNNDAKACALAEMWFGSCRDCDDFMYITASTGIGGAFVLDSRLYNGAFGRAGEVGNSFLEHNGRPNGHGRLGTLEMYAATGGMAQTYLEHGGTAPADGRPVNGAYIAERARAGDRAALDTFELEGRYLGSLIAQACNLLDLERVVIGGGISLAYDLYRDSLERTLFEQKYWRDDEFSVVPTVLGYEGALVGAATVAYLGVGEPLTRPGSPGHKLR